jgi:hypothetical protein
MIESAIETIVEALDIDLQEIFVAEASSAEGIIAVEALGDSYFNLLASIDQAGIHLVQLEPGVDTGLTQAEINTHLDDLRGLRNETAQAINELAREYQAIVNTSSTEELEAALERFENGPKARLESTLNDINSRVSNIITDINNHRGAPV